MGNQLLVRAYNVGCGDCIYVRIPDAKDGFHILIDCGKKGSAEMLKVAIDHMRDNLLPLDAKSGKKRLDLLVATHRHEDHIKGFDKKWFADILVKNVWMSVAMDPKNPQAEKTNKLHAFATEKMRGLAASGLALSEEVQLLASLYGVSNNDADEFLFSQKPTYVSSGSTGKDLKLPAGTTIQVLAPEKDIDHFYLGEEVDASLKGLAGPGTGFAKKAVAVDGAPVPLNISASDFRTLQSRMLSNALEFAAKDSAIQNNLSVVLLIEWKKRRLLFVGDAEWHGEFVEGKQNGSWNVMWEKHHKKHLAEPVDFLKVGHHGSMNATPHPAEWKKASAKATASPSVWEILDTLLPLPKAGKKPTAQAIVSTEREFYDPIPESKLLVELAKRVRNTRIYDKELKAKKIDAASIWNTSKAKRKKFYEDFEQPFLDQAQPWRTDLEFQLSQQGFVDVVIDEKA